MRPDRVAADVAQIIENANVLPEYSNFKTELAYLLGWRIWSLVDETAPEWMDYFGPALEEFFPEVSSEGFHERIPAYNEAEANQDGGGPGWHITQAFHSFVTGSRSLQAERMMELSIRLAAVMKLTQDVLLHHAKNA